MIRARENPFSVERVSSLPFQFEKCSPASLLETLANNNWRGAIVGKHGSGKTTLLHTLCMELQRRDVPLVKTTLAAASVRENIARLFQLLLDANSQSLLVVDGAEQLPSCMWRLVSLRARWCKGLLITSHRHGMLPLLFECRTNEALLSHLFHLLGQARAAQHADELFKRHQGDIREIFFSLYDLHANAN